MKITKTALEEVVIIESDVFGDNRGWFTETYSKRNFESAGIKLDFIQDNHSMSAQKGTLRGLHFQNNPKAQSKLVRCTSGRILDIAVDLRKGSPTYKKWVSVELSQDNKLQLLVPKGFAHGFLTLTENAEVQYKVDEYYSPEHDRSIKYDDPDIGVDWGNLDVILSNKDLNAPLLKESDVNFNYTVLVTGGTGQLGHDVTLVFENESINVLTPDRNEFNLNEPSMVKAYIKHKKPDLIIHCAAYTAVDMAESEKELCYKINVLATQAIADVANDINAKLVYISTDYVFNGDGEQPYTEDHLKKPINYYGLTKDMGEEIIKERLEKFFIIRTSWLYGLSGSNFVKTMLKLAKVKDELSVVDDQVGAPTYTKDLANMILELSKTKEYGIYHGVNEGFCSWYDFAKEIFKEANISIKVNPVTSDDFPTHAKRPHNSRLSKGNTDKIKLNRMPHWNDALKRFLNELKNMEE